MTKTYAVGFNHDAQLSYKNWSQKSKQFWRHFVLMNQVIWLAERNLSPKLKNQTVRLLEMTEFAVSMDK